MRWAYGVCTVPSRIGNLLPQTLASLVRAGFETPRLFVDGVKDPSSYREQFCLEVTNHWPQIGVSGNRILAWWELLIRFPLAQRYVIFEDDILACKNLRQYLEQIEFPDNGYWNLLTAEQNQHLATNKGFYLSNQRGLGGQATVLSRDALRQLLGQPYTVGMPSAVITQWSRIDGLVLHAMKVSGRKECVHNPSLVQHIGNLSALSCLHKSKCYPTAVSFPGESFDALGLLQ